jgi:hypothetical protein
MFSLIVGGEPVPDVHASIAQHSARVLPEKFFFGEVR